MLTKDELLQTPNYLLTKYQGEIYRQIINYMMAHNISQTDLANKLGVSSSYISQVLNGNFNFTLKKLIELGLSIDKVPVINFVEKDKYWENVNIIGYSAEIQVPTSHFSSYSPVNLS